MAKHIGIVGCTEEGAALCYRTICQEGAAIMGPNTHPEVTVHTFPQSEYDRHIQAGDWTAVAGLMVVSVTKLSRAGAEFAICPDNSLHLAFDLVIEQSPIPWLHMVEEVGTEAKRRGYGCLGILGTRQVMAGPVYGPKLAELGIDHQVPDKDEQARINDIIFGELVRGQLLETSRVYLSEILAGLGQRGCDAVVIGCTKLPLLLRADETDTPLLDSKRLLARAALREATGSLSLWSAD